MSYPHRAAAGVPGFAAERATTPAPAPQALRRRGPAEPAATALRARAPMTRRYDASWLTPSGGIDSSTRIAPAIPLFEEAFSALARGAVVLTDEGPVAIEDIQPGMRALTADGRAETVTWVGSMVIYPGMTSEAEGEAVTLTRITAEAFGQGRPMPDLVLGPRARLCLRDPRLMRVAGVERAFVPARAFLDGVSVIEVTPIAPVTAFHLVLERQGALRVDGLEVESYHPGEGVEGMIEPRMLSLFLAQFPQIERIADFGPMAAPRLTRFEVESLWD